MPSHLSSGHVVNQFATFLLCTSALRHTISIPAQEIDGLVWNSYWYSLTTWKFFFLNWAFHKNFFLGSFQTFESYLQLGSYTTGASCLNAKVPWAYHRTRVQYWCCRIRRKFHAVPQVYFSPQCGPFLSFRPCEVWNDVKAITLPFIIKTIVSTYLLRLLNVS